MKILRFIGRILSNKWFALLLCILCTAFIFSHSMVNAKKSSEQSGKIVRVLTEAAEKIGFDVSEGAPATKVIRKTAHFTEFFALGALCYFMQFTFTRHPYKRGTPLILLQGVLTSVCDETLQYFFDGRSPEVLDVWIDIAGFVASYAAMMAIFTISYIVISKRKANSEKPL